MSETAQLSGSSAGSVGSRGRAPLAAVAAVLMLLWPALLNGGAFYFPDSGTYLRSADAMFTEITGRETEWSDRRQLYVKPPASPVSATPHHSPAASAARAPTEGVPLHPVLLGRSIYYGLIIFPFVVLFGSLGAVFVQAMLAVLTIWLTLVAFGAERPRMPRLLLASAAVLAGLTSLPFFVSMMMPDVFAGFSIALAVSAIVGWRRLTRWERIGLAALLILSGMVHSSHVLVLFGLAGIALVLMLCTKIQAAPALALMMFAGVSGIAGEQLFIHAVNYRLGEAPVRPPFLTARLIADGPGLRLLKKRCPAIGLEACRYLDRMPRDSDTFLWSLDRRDGVFSAESIPVQRKLGQEDFGFALATLREDPVDVIGGASRGMVRQLLLNDLDIFNFKSELGGEATLGLPGPAAAEISASRFAQGTMPVTFSRWANLVTATLAGLFLVAVIFGRTRESGDHRLRAGVGLFLAALALNATVTGAMSKPHNRYNVRVVWVLQLAALAIFAARSDRKLEKK